MVIWLSCTESTKVLTPNAFRRSLGVNSLSFTQRTTPESLVCNFSFWLLVSFCFIFFPFADLGTEPRTLPTLGKCGSQSCRPSLCLKQALPRSRLARTPEGAASASHVLGLRVCASTARRLFKTLPRLIALWRVSTQMNKHCRF